jgi:hypothetical protein
MARPHDAARASHRCQNNLLKLTPPHPPPSQAVQFNKVYPTPCTTTAFEKYAAASDKRYSIGTDFRVRRNRCNVFLAMSEGLCDADNALDARGGAELGSVLPAAPARISRRFSADVLG